MHALRGKRNISSAEATWVRGTTNSSMVKEPLPEKEEKKEATNI